jgi:hypothetical protein
MLTVFISIPPCRIDRSPFDGVVAMFFQGLVIMQT